MTLKNPRKATNIVTESKYKVPLVPAVQTIIQTAISLPSLNTSTLYSQIANMQFNLLSLLAAPLLISQAYACLSMDAVKFSDTVVSAQIFDNGDNTCNFPNSASTGVDGHYWFTCQSGFSAFLTSDFTTLAYENNGANYRWPVNYYSTQYECDPLTGACGTSVRYTASGAC